MSFEPTNEQLIDFVYGNLPESERLQVELAIEQDKSVKEQVKALNESRSFLHNLEDEEILEPDKFIWELTRKHQKQRILWPISAIAASFTLLLVVAYFTQFRVSYGLFQLAFGDITPTELPQSLSNEQVQNMINKSIVANNVDFIAQLDDTKSEFEAKLVANNKLQLKDMQRIAANSKELPKAQVESYLSQLNETNRTMVNDFFTASAVEQKEYMNTILTDFFEYMDSQRKEDYNVLQTNIDDLEYKNYQKTRETDQVIASILTTVGGGSMGQ
jgi:hypothetical protein